VQKRLHTTLVKSGEEGEHDGDAALGGESGEGGDASRSPAAPASVAAGNWAEEKEHVCDLTEMEDVLDKHES